MSNINKQPWRQLRRSTADCALLAQRVQIRITLFSDSPAQSVMAAAEHWTDRNADRHVLCELKSAQDNDKDWIAVPNAGVAVIVRQCAGSCNISCLYHPNETAQLVSMTSVRLSALYLQHTCMALPVCTAATPYVLHLQVATDCFWIDDFRRSV